MRKSGPGAHRDLPRVDHLPARAAGAGDLEVLPAGQMAMQDRRSVLTRVVGVAPPHQAHDQRIEAQPLLRQPVLIARRPRLIGLTRQAPLLDEGRTVTNDLEIPSRPWKSLKRRNPRKQSRRSNKVQRSPITARDLATEHASRPIWFHFTTAPSSQPTCSYMTINILIDAVRIQDLVSSVSERSCGWPRIKSEAPAWW